MTTLPELPELTFEEEKHIYRLNGKYIPSVTTIMKPLSAALYKDIDEAVLQAAAERGKTVHECIENFIKFGFTDVPPELNLYFDGFQNWWDEYKPEVLGSEYRAYHPTLRYAGTSDLICMVRDIMVCVDFKTTAAINEMLTRVQLEAYARALMEHKIPIRAKAILHLGKDGVGTIHQHKAGDTEAWNVFGSLLTVWNYQQKYKWR